MNSEELGQLRAAGCDLSNAVVRKKELEKEIRGLQSSLTEARNRVERAKERLLKRVGVGSNIQQRVLHLDDGTCIVLTFQPKPMRDDGTPYGEDRVVVSLGNADGTEEV